MKKRNSSGKYIAGLILLIALCVFGVFITTKGITKNKIGRASNIELGLDLAGGVSITYEVDGKNVSDSDMRIPYTNFRNVWKVTAQKQKFIRKEKIVSISKSPE